MWLYAAPQRFFSHLILWSALVVFTALPAGANGPHSAVWWVLRDDPVLSSWIAILVTETGDPTTFDKIPADYGLWFELAAQCGLATSEDAAQPSLLETWRVKPCLAEGLRGRLALEGIEPYPAPIGALQKDGPHPLCLALFSPLSWYFDEARKTIPLDLCEKANAHIPTSTDDIGFLYADRRGGFGFFGYRLIGHRYDLVALLETRESTGGSGQFSGILFLQNYPESDLTFLDCWSLGDRCNGGLQDVDVIDSMRIETAENITSFDLFTLDDRRYWRAKISRSGDGDDEEIRSQGEIQLRPYVDLESSASGCIGTVHYRYNLREGAVEFAGVSIESLVDFPAVEDRHRLQACFNKVVADGTKNLPRRLGPYEYDALKNAFRDDCIND